jgi:ribosomal protein S6
MWWCGQIRRSRNMQSTYQEQAQAGKGAPRPQRRKEPCCWGLPWLVEAGGAVTRYNCREVECDALEWHEVAYIAHSTIGFYMCLKVTSICARKRELWTTRKVQNKLMRYIFIFIFGNKLKRIQSQKSKIQGNAERQSQPQRWPGAQALLKVGPAVFSRHALLNNGFLHKFSRHGLLNNGFLQG